MNPCPGRSVGAIIRRKEDNAYLCVYRKKYPMGLAFVAGHFDNSDLNNPEIALKREVKEETGLTVLEYKLVLHNTFPNQCPRSSDYTHHEWYVYQINSYIGTPQLMESDKHQFVEFLSVKHILEYIQVGEYDPAWFKYILPVLALTR